jgi:hypothetical protein
MISFGAAPQQAHETRLKYQACRSGTRPDDADLRWKRQSGRVLLDRTREPIEAGTSVQVCPKIDISGEPSGSPEVLYQR